MNGRIPRADQLDMLPDGSVVWSAQENARHERSTYMALDAWCSSDPGERGYEVSRTQTGWLVKLRADLNGLLTEQTEKPTKPDALASAAWIVTTNPYLE